MTRPFRFGVQVASLDPAGWAADVREIERLGYSTLFLPDHFGPQWDPVVALTAAAAATERLRVGTLVLDVDYRHPVVFAKESATLQLVSGGRLEFGIGAGWMQTDYDQAGMTYDPPGTRIARLEEALQIITSMWRNERTDFAGKHYTIRGIAQAAPLPEGSAPPILIGGGGKRLLSLAGRYADIVGINPRLHEGKVVADTPADLTPERVREKVGWVREAAERAGRDPDAIELHALVFVVAITDDPSGIRRSIAANSGMSEAEVADCPLFLTGSASEICERLERRREQTGISYIAIQGGRRELLAEFADAVMGPLQKA